MKTSLTTQQKVAAHTIGIDLCVDAGAGSGKTTVLVERIMYLLDQGVSLHRIVAITFTRKAAAEMKERLRKAIHQRPENDPRSMDKWRSIELEVDSARITTIDGFCAALLHEHALRIGLDPDFATLGDEEAPLLQREIAEATLAELLEQDGGPAQRLVVEHGLERLSEFLCTALGLEARFSDAARRYAGLNAAGVAALWRAQAEELQRERYRALAALPEISDICARLEELAGHCTDASDKREVVRQNAVRFLTALLEQRDNDSLREAVAGLGKLNLQGGRSAAWTRKESMDEVTAAVKHVRKLVEKFEEPPYDPSIEASAAQLTLDLIIVFSETAAAYRAAKRARTALDFGDLLTLTAEMLHKNPELCARIAAGIDHLLIDEFQDTNSMQLALAEALAGADGAQLFVVGDAKQSVYRFRGAEVEVFAQARERAQKRLPLDENFRSIQSLIAFINTFFESSALLARVEPLFQKLTASRTGSHEPSVEFLVPESNDELADQEENDDDNDETGREAETDLVAARIAELCGPSGAQVYDKGRGEWRPARFGDVAILYHAATHAGEYEAALRRHGIPANIIAGSGFYTRQEILDLHNLFSTALDPWNEPALAAFLRSPLAGVSDDTLFRLTRTGGLAAAFWNRANTGHPLEDAILDRARALIAFIQAHREMPVAAVLREVLAKTGYEAVLLSLYHGVQKAENVHKLTDLARSFGGAGRQGLSAFTDYLASLARNGLRSGDAELLAAESGAVTLMTVHKAKGLEFPIVVLVETGRVSRNNKGPICIADPRRGLAVSTHDPRGETKWPVFGEHLHRLEKENEAAENARVLYVAMTRARDQLLIAGPSNPKKNTWMRTVSEMFELSGRAHGDTISGDTWQARVTRKATGAAPTIREPQTKLPLDVERLLNQAAPLRAEPAPGQTIPVRALLDRLHPHSGDDHGATRAKSTLDRRLLGTAAHALLERWSFTTPPPIAQAAREYFPAPGAYADCAQELTDISEKIQKSALWPMLARAKSLRRELPFLLDVAGILLSGTIDAVINNTALIDYKLGAPTPARVARYQTQLQLYAAAIRAATGRAPTVALLYYLGSGELVPVDVGSEALDAVIARAAAALGTGVPSRG